MKNGYRRWCAILTLSVAIAGCATPPKLSDEETVAQQDKIAQLERRIKEARSQGVNYLAPESYKSALQSLDDASKSASDNKFDKADAATSAGLAALDKAEHDAATSRDLLAEILAMRERAIRASARQLFEKNTAALEKELSELANLIEKNQLEKAKRMRPELISAYADLELAALKETTIDAARASINSAKEEDAETQAPKTLKLAEEELALSLSILDADRTQTDKANRHAKRAKWHAERSRNLTEVSKDFDRRDYTMEDVLLWHQQQLSDIYQPLGSELPFNQPASNTVTTMRSTYTKLLKERAEINSLSAQTEAKLHAQTALNQEEVDRLKQEFELTAKKREAQKRKEKEEQQRFESVQSLFTQNEANVYRQRQNVLVSAHGFRFPSGGSEIEADNFAMLNKIVRAINTFPNSAIEVSGHTDSTGQDNTNKWLSQERAEKVVKFLIEIGGFAPSRLTALGYGEARPVASNKTRGGRAANRRVEILIVNP
ncbi:MAG: OmpA family protein [Gammaproteobacteria bacterium]|nr:OmpA family protein [Gammaproteobacteria bacterium]